MIRPPSLNKGDTVAIVSTARKVSAEDLQPGIDQLNAWGMNVELGANLFASLNQFAGTDEQRREDFQRTLDNSRRNASCSFIPALGAMFMPVCHNPTSIHGVCAISGH